MWRPECWPVEWPVLMVNVIQPELLAKCWPELLPICGAKQQARVAAYGVGQWVACVAACGAAQRAGCVEACDGSSCIALSSRLEG